MNEDSGEEALSVDTFFEMVLDNVCVAGFDGYFRRLSPSWTESLGWTTEEFLSRPVIEFVHPDDRDLVLAGRERLTNGQDMGLMTNRYLCKDGGHRWFEWKSVADVDKKLVYAVARDITDHRRTQRQLREAHQREHLLERQLIFADRMASVGTLAAGVAHEVNNPLAYVTSNLSMILAELDQARDDLADERWETLHEMAVDAREGVERIGAIVRDLQTFARAGEGSFERLDLPAVLDHAIGVAHNEIDQRARLERDYAPAPPVQADHAHLSQVFVNLLVNATQAIEPGEWTANQIRVSAATDAHGRAVVEVRDTGKGIAPGDLERIFEPFFTTKPVDVGTGLGLFICHNIITGIGGEITVDSQVDVGTTFRVVLPPANPDPSQSKPSSQS